MCSKRLSSHFFCSFFVSSGNTFLFMTIAHVVYLQEAKHSAFKEANGLSFGNTVGVWKCLIW
jgi:hypothetical protein